MKKISLILLLFILLDSVEAMPVEAHQKADEHYEEIEAMLFDNENFKDSIKDENVQAAICILEYASTLCIDQFGNSNQDKLDDLNEWGVPGIPSNVSKINPSIKKDGIKLSPRNHRTYTHQGWDYSYEDEKNGDLARWSERKNIMLASTEKVFDFSTFSGKWLFVDFGYSDKCDSFSALIYYNHLLGDYLEDVDEKEGNLRKFNRTSNGDKMPFASNSSKPVDIFSELEKHLAILFKDQADSRVYDSLIDDIKILAYEARKLSGNSEGTVIEENFEKMRTCVQELMDILTGENGYFNAINDLLMNEEFFTDVFD